MSQSQLLKIKGLYPSYNELSEVPEGALLEADNIDILKDSIAEPRRGFDRLATGYSNADHRTAKTWFYQSKQFAHHGTLGSESTISYLDAGTWNSVGSFSAPTGFKMRTLEANQNLYFTSSTGIQKLAAYNGTATLAGAYKGLDLNASVSVSASTWLADDFRVAYRAVWGYKDANNNLILGAPSQRESFKNTSGGTIAVDLRITIPSGVTTSWFVQLYRSAQVDNTATDTEPGDELGLVYETNPDGTDITNGYIDITDIVPDSLRGATIYTAASQQGLSQGNERPPLANDMAVFRDCVFYLNTTSKHRFVLTLLSASLMSNDETITIGGITYTAKATEDIAAAEFDLVTGGSAAQNIRDTALSLVRVINRHASSTVYAYYLSGPDDLPGKMLIEERGIGGASFALTSNSPEATYSPPLPSSGTSQSSSNERYKNGLAWSKPNQSEAVPLSNFKEVGNRNLDGLRAVPLRDALYIFKDKEAIYKVTGYYPNFQIDVVDSSAKLIGAETPAILNNQIFCLTDQGVTVVSDSTKVISRPIEQNLLEIFGSDPSSVAALAFGVAYETDRKYYLCLPQTTADEYSTQQYVFNTFTNAWTRHLLNITCGLVEDNLLYFGDALSNFINVERKTYSFADYVDYGFATTITVIDSRTITLGSGIDNVDVGDILYQSASAFGTVTSVDVPNSTVEVETNPGLSVASATILKAISCKITWAPVTSGNPGILKQNHTCTLLFKSDFAGTGELIFNTELSQYDEAVPISGRGIGNWGLFPWDERPWGGATLRRPVRQLVPRDKQRSSQLTISFELSYGYSPWQLQGMTVFGNPGSEKVAA